MFERPEGRAQEPARGDDGISRPWLFQGSCMDVRAGPSRRLNTEELMLLNCDAGEDS